MCTGDKETQKDCMHALVKNQPSTTRSLKTINSVDNRIYNKNCDRNFWSQKSSLLMTLRLKKQVVAKFATTLVRQRSCKFTNAL